MKRFYRLFIIFLPIFLIVTTNSVPVWAISQNDFDSIFNNTPFYDATDPWCTSDGGVATVTLVGNDNLQQIFNYFASNGYSTQQAAGITGNIYAESHGDPEIWEANGKDYQSPPQPDSTKEGWGIAQWTPPSQILDYAQTTGLPVYELSTQVSFLWNQLNGTSPNNEEKPAGDLIKQTTTIDQAAVAFMQDYERPANDGANSQNAMVREKLAEEVFALYAAAATSGSNTISATVSGGCGGTGGAGGSVVGCDFGSGTGLFTTSSAPATTVAGEISVPEMCQRVQQLVYDRTSSVFTSWVQGIRACRLSGNTTGGSCAVGYCDWAVAHAWDYGASGYDTAADHWAAMQKDGFAHPGDYSPPVGALLFYGSEPDGHITIYLGNNMVMSTDVSGPGVVGAGSGGPGYVWIAPASTVAKWVGAPYLGWSEPRFEIN